MNNSNNMQVFFLPYPVCRRLSTSRISLSRCLWRSLSRCSLIWSNDRMSFFSLLTDLRSRLLELWRGARGGGVWGEINFRPFQLNPWTSQLH